MGDQIHSIQHKSLVLGQGSVPSLCTGRQARLHELVHWGTCCEWGVRGPNLLSPLSALLVGGRRTWSFASKRIPSSRRFWRASPLFSGCLPPPLRPNWVWRKKSGFSSGSTSAHGVLCTAGSPSSWGLDGSLLTLCVSSERGLYAQWSSNFVTQSLMFWKSSFRLWRILNTFIVGIFFLMWRIYGFIIRFLKSVTLTCWILSWNMYIQQ